MPNITIRDVAKKAGVGVATVSRVLNGSASVRDATRQKVLATIDELGFSPNQTARRLSLGKTMTVAVMAPFLVRPSYTERLRGIESVLSDSKYDFVFFNIETVGGRDTWFREVQQRERVDGILLISLPPSNDEVAQFAEAGIPVVLIDAAHPKLSHVIIDDIAGGYLATNHLIELGHRKISYVSDFMQKNPINFRPVFDRYQGFRNAMADASLPINEAYYYECRVDRRESRQLAHHLLTLDDPPTAVFTYSDLQAIGFLQAAEDLGIAVPEQLSIIGFDDIEAAEYMRLTTVRQPLFNSGVRGANLLLKQMMGKISRTANEIMPIKLIIRNTTAAPSRM